MLGVVGESPTPLTDMKRILLIMLLGVAGCAGVPHQTCMLIKFDHHPSPSTIHALAATTKDSDKVIQSWFDKGERGFILHDNHADIDQAAIQSAHSEHAQVIDLYVHPLL